MSENMTNETSTDWDGAFVKAANKKDYRAMDAALAGGADINVTNVRGITVLHAAVMSRSLDLVAWLAKRGAAASFKTWAGDTALHDAAKLSDPDYLRELLKAKEVDVNVVNSQGSTPLMEAAGALKVENAKQLISAGANVNHKAKSGSSALLIAACRHDHEMVKLLLSKKANANDADAYGVTALISAAAVLPRYDAGGEEDPQVASYKTMTELVKAGASINAVAKSGNTALAEAARCTNRRGMVLLVDAGANPNVHSTAGVSGEMTPLMMAAYKQDEELIQKLLNAGADINFTNNKGQSAVMMAMMAPIQNEKQQAHAKATIESLLKAGATLAQDKESKIGLAHYGVYTESPELLRIAKEQGALEQRAQDGETAIFYAASTRKKEMLHLLKELGADFGAKNDAGETVLHQLASAPYPAKVSQAIDRMRQKNDEKLKDEARKLEEQSMASALEFTKLLVDFGAGINEPDKKGNTPLHHALKSMAFGKVDLPYINFLLECGADIAVRNEIEDSPFILAVKIARMDLVEDWAKYLVKEGKQDLIERVVYDVSWSAPEHEAQVQAMAKAFETLKKYGASVSFQDEDGQFPLLIASATNQEDLVNALIELGADVNQKNAEGEVAAFHSVKENHPNITRILFEKGCNPDAVRNDGESLITIAYRHHNSTAVQQIVQHRPIWREANSMDPHDSMTSPLTEEGSSSTKKMGP